MSLCRRNQNMISLTLSTESKVVLLSPYMNVAARKNVYIVDYLAHVPHYKQLALLGHGAFGSVIKALDLRVDPPELVAIKLFPRGKLVANFSTYICREIENQSGLKHPLIITIREVFLTPSHLAIAMEFAKGGDLYNYTLGRHCSLNLAENQARWIFQQLVIALDYCHLKGISNRDLKLENLLLGHDGMDGARPILKISDFGYSKAPEVMTALDQYDAKKADIWSCGIILYAILYAKYPFDVRRIDFADRLLKADFEFPETFVVSDSCKDLLSKILVVDPEKRITLQGILAHPWFLTNLPEGALDMNEYLSKKPSKFDQDVWSVYRQKVADLVALASKDCVPLCYY